MNLSRNLAPIGSQITAPMTMYEAHAQRQDQRLSFGIDYILSLSSRHESQEQQATALMNQPQKFQVPHSYAPQQQQVHHQTADLQAAKKKKMRTVFTRQQVTQLESVFNAKRYLTSSERNQLANLLHLSETQVKIWFQNKRNKQKRSSPAANYHTSFLASAALTHWTQLGLNLTQKSQSWTHWAYMIPINHLTRFNRQPYEVWHHRHLSVASGKSIKELGKQFRFALLAQIWL